MTVRELELYLNTVLNVDQFRNVDSGLNGLQLGSGSRPVQKVAFAVDACMASFECAADWGADLLVVHHGIFWGGTLPLTGTHYDRVAFLVKNNLALYAAHLPLDAHGDFGNNIGLARQLGLASIEPFGVYKGQHVGLRGILPKPMRLEEVSELLFGDSRGTLGQLNFGKEFNSTVGIISGGGTNEVHQAIAAGLDLYITGESGHTIYHPCQEAGINVLFGGHYATEIWGVALLAKHIREELKLETRFFDLPTGY